MSEKEAEKEKFYQRRVNRQYKDRMFDRIFRIPENLLSLFNALNGTAWTDADQLEIHTIAGAIYICIHGDLAFVYMNRMNLWEHQSTWNPNMPARGLLYFAQAYQRYVVMHSVNLISKGLKKLPFPQYFVFYNGLEEEPDRSVLRFSDAFMGMGQITDQNGVPLIPALEIQAVMININLGRNETLMRACPVLKEYAQFVAKVRENIGRRLSAEEAVKKAVNDCINEGILRDLL
ncbi:MAG: Rpn family recombination-promoting nuclease/putative transposase, partial [Clostridiales bacterium]|nr:Rpn family recombination-promoting nuclease/putative transposase [Clostridiales bacterium]